MNELMYDELIKWLWECASGECFNCSQYTPTTNASICQKELMKQAIDAIEELATNYDAATDIMKHQTEYIEELEAKLPRWIPVTEPPKEEESGTFITAYSKGGVSQNWYMTFPHGGGKWYQNSKDTGEVTHWMPFPEPPKEE